MVQTWQTVLAVTAAHANNQLLPTEGRFMATLPRLIHLLALFDFARDQLADCMVDVIDDESLQEPGPTCFSIRLRTTEAASTLRSKS